MIFVTGGAGFIGSNFVLDWLEHYREPVLNIDKLTYSGNPNNLVSAKKNPRHFFIHGDISDRSMMKKLLYKFSPRLIVHFAAETHVDRSIHDPELFLQTNVMGTFSLLEEVLAYWKSLPSRKKKMFRFLHISTDEVYGSLQPGEPSFNERSPYAPNSPYSASKAASDHLVRVYHHTYELPTLITHCSNNYGPYQHPEKLIPLMILHALEGKTLPLYGDGLNERNWLFVKDHCTALRLVAAKGKIGEVYLIGDDHSRTNKEVVMTLCDLLDELRPLSGHSYHTLIRSVKDRPGHDKRYDIDASKLIQELGWSPQMSFEEGIRYTIMWYLNHKEWMGNALNEEWQHWMKKQYEEKLIH
jgi:dTDP-glucose 4,6-dehydratase